AARRAPPFQRPSAARRVRPGGAVAAPDRDALRGGSAVGHAPQSRHDEHAGEHRDPCADAGRGARGPGPLAAGRAQDRLLHGPACTSACSWCCRSSSGCASTTSRGEHGSRSSMRLAVFTSKYPARVSTFLERDMHALVAAGVELDIFPIYPLDRELWRYSLGVSGEDVVPRTRVHHRGLLQSLARTRPWRTRELGTVMQAGAGVASAALPSGGGPVARSLYVL